MYTCVICSCYRKLINIFWPDYRTQQLDGLMLFITLCRTLLVMLKIRWVTESCFVLYYTKMCKELKPTYQEIKLWVSFPTECRLRLSEAKLQPYCKFCVNMGLNLIFFVTLNICHLIRFKILIIDHSMSQCYKKNSVMKALCFSSIIVGVASVRQ